MSTLDEAVTAAAAGLARPGDVVLLAPGYKSFDQFVDFEDRGRAFGEAVAAAARRTRWEGLMAARAGRLTEGLAGRWRRRGGARRRSLRAAQIAPPRPPGSTAG